MLLRAYSTIIISLEWLLVDSSKVQDATDKTIQYPELSGYISSPSHKLADCTCLQRLYHMFLLFVYSPNFFILDEPTNHLDMETIEALGLALQKFQVNFYFSTLNPQNYLGIC